MEASRAPEVLDSEANARAHIVYSVTWLSSSKTIFPITPEDLAMMMTPQLRRTVQVVRSKIAVKRKLYAHYLDSALRDP